MTDIAREIDTYLHRLFPICRSITGSGNRDTLKILQGLVPIEIREYPSGTQVYDWVVPPEWRVRDAFVKNSAGERLVDFMASNIHLVGYSEPVDRWMTINELLPHLHIHPDLPEAIPYRTTYYKRDWGFCVTRDQMEQLTQEVNPLHVVVDSEFIEDGSLTVGELLIQGELDQEILISTYICHPSLANDNLSGAVMTAFLARHLLEQSGILHSYRIVFVPETIGAIAYCAMNETAMKKIDTGVVITTVGGPGRFGYKQSFDASHHVNAMIEQVFREEGVDFITYPFDIHGSDERQYSSQGFRINVASITKDKYYEYPYYHTSLDNLGFVNGGQIADSLRLYEALLDRMDKNVCYRNRYPHCEVMLSKHDLYPKSGGAQVPKIGGKDELDLILWMLYWADGHHSFQEICTKIGVEEGVLLPIAHNLAGKGLLERC